MNILIIGQEGQLAFELQRSLAPLGNLSVRGRTSTPTLDLADPAEIEAQIRSIKPNVVINAAAYTAVDRAETDVLLAAKVNADGVAILAEECLKQGAALVHYSTDYVFPGNGTRPYLETDPTAPSSIYGKTKLQGENAIRDSGVSHLIFRTAWVFGLHGQNFLKTMLRLMAERPSLGIVDDQIGQPTWSRMIAEATALVLAQSLIRGKLDFSDRSGTYHLTAGGQTSWYGFAKAIREEAIQKGVLQETATEIKPITTAEYPLPAPRPSYSVLSNQKLSDTFGIQLPNWHDQLRLCLSSLNPS